MECELCHEKMEVVHESKTVCCDYEQEIKVYVCALRVLALMMVFALGLLLFSMVKCI